MTAAELLGRTVLSDKVAASTDELGYALNIAGVYQDAVTREWAMESCLRAAQLAGEERIQNTWHDVNSLSDHANLLDAVRAALAADVIVVSVYAADELPSELHVWIEAWLPRRRSRVGALTAVLGVAEPLEPQSIRTIEYLQTVARKAQLDFFPQKRKRPAGSSAASIKVNAERAGSNAHALKKLYGHHQDAYNHWGLND